MKYQFVPNVLVQFKKVPDATTLHVHNANISFVGDVVEYIMPLIIMLVFSIIFTDVQVYFFTFNKRNPNK